MKTPRASFVIPAYNAEAFLAQAVLSCRAQSIKEIEIIIVDDGSKDGTKELAQWHAAHDPRVKYAALHDNQGRSAARNFGNTLVQSPFILVLDADDIALKHRVRDTLLTFQMKTPDVVYGSFQVINENDEILGVQKAGPFNIQMAIQKKMNFIGHSTMAYRKGITRNVEYDEGEYSKLGLDDWKFQMDAFLKGYKFGACSVPLSKYRIYQLPNRTYGSPTEFFRDEKRVNEIKNEYLGQIADTVKTPV